MSVIIMDKTTSSLASRFRKGDAFVDLISDSLIFMEINEMEDSTENMDFYIVTWYMINEKGLNAQRRFPMAARNGKFINFEPISRSLLKEAKRLMHQYDACVKLLNDDSSLIKLRYNEYCCKLIDLLPNTTDSMAIMKQRWKNMNIANYKITATRKQVELLALACNQAMRIHIGQLSDPLTVLLNFELGYCRHHNGESAPIEIQEKLDELSELCWHGSHYGYGYDETSKECWKLYKMFKKNEHAISDSTFQLSFNQLELLRNACEQAARLRTGQLEHCFINELLNAYQKEVKFTTISGNIREYVTMVCNYLHTLCWNQSADSYYGMNYNDDSDSWWDLYQVFRYRIWKDKHPNPSNPDMLTVDSLKPLHTGKEPFVRVEKVF